MISLRRFFARLLTSIAAVVALAVTVPAPAIAQPSPATAEPGQCELAHPEHDWRWHDDDRGEHWDHEEWLPGQNRKVWMHYRSETRRCTDDDQREEDDDG